MLFFDVGKSNSFPSFSFEIEDKMTDIVLKREQCRLCNSMRIYE